jgi:RNA polymerase sigma-70 factor (ECF subfamily)
MPDKKNISDEALFIRYARGDTEAFRTLTDRYAVCLLHYCMGYVHSKDDAEDIVQETFIRTIKSAATFRATSRFSTWIFKIARNRCLDYVKTQSTRRELQKDQKEYIAEATSAEPVLEPGADVFQIDTTAMEQAMGYLTPLEAETIRMTFQADWTTQQIADLQGCSKTTVRVRRFQALEKMRHVLLKELGNTDNRMRETS